MVHRNRSEIETDELTRGVVRKTRMKKMPRLSLLFTLSQREQTKERSGLKLPPAGRKQAHCPPLLPFTSAALHRHGLVDVGEKGLAHTKLAARIDRSGSQTWATQDPPQTLIYHILLPHCSTGIAQAPGAAQCMHCPTVLYQSMTVLARDEEVKSACLRPPPCRIIILISNLSQKSITWEYKAINYWPGDQVTRGGRTSRFSKGFIPRGAVCPPSTATPTQEITTSPKPFRMGFMGSAV